MIQEGLFLLSKQFEKKGKKTKRWEAVRLQFRCNGLKINSMSTSDMYKTHCGLYNVDGSVFGMSSLMSGCVPRVKTAGGLPFESSRWCRDTHGGGALRYGAH